MWKPALIADYIADYDKAMEYDNKALEIYLSVFGEDHPLTFKMKEKISEVQTKMKESEKYFRLGGEWNSFSYLCHKIPTR
jgi:hypothetical protein